MVKERIYTRKEKNRSLSCYCTVAKDVPTEHYGVKKSYYAGLQCTCSEARTGASKTKAILHSRPKRYSAVLIRRSKDWR